MAETYSLLLEPVTDLSSIGQLYSLSNDALNSGAPVVEVQAQNVERLKTPTLQLLISLKNSLLKENRQLKISDPSSSFINIAQCLGLEEYLIEREQG